MSTLKGWKDLTIGTAILEPGSSEAYHTGGWRDYRPIHSKEKCTNCLLCWIYCPEGAVLVEDGKVAGIKYDYCKGCGICAEECPAKVKAIEMIDEPKIF
ncbi:MAG: 4Fe-4S binding protein [Thermodesulfobacteriota bacterium]|nr:4Fe-4S binding protein [Thermodesulfobacteriota bacterium]